MILGIGTDIVNIERIKDVLERYNEKFVNRCFSDNELSQAEKITDKQKSIAYLAKRWAAKEATAKALGTGFRDGIFLKDIEIKNDDLGCPYIELKEKAVEYLKSKTTAGYNANIKLSISDDYPYAIAFVIIEIGREE